MTLPELLGFGVAIGVPSVGGLLSYGMLRQKVTDLSGRVDKAESAATQVSGLVSAVEGMGSRFAEQIKHLVEVMDLHNTHTREQLKRIEGELGHVKNNAAFAKDAVTEIKARRGQG